MLWDEQDKLYVAQGIFFYKHVREEYNLPYFNYIVSIFFSSSFFFFYNEEILACI